jgi:hypothetical protein
MKDTRRSSDSPRRKVTKLVYKAVNSFPLDWTAMGFRRAPWNAKFQTGLLYTGRLRSEMFNYHFIGINASHLEVWQ